MDPLRFLDNHGHMGNDNQVSLEGFFQNMGDNLRNVFKGRKPELAKAGLKSIAAELKKTYMNPSWLKHRRFVTGEVSIPASGYGQYLTEDMEPVVMATIRENTRVTGLNRKVVNQAMAYIKPTMDFMAKGGWKDPAQAKVQNAKFDPQTRHPYVEANKLKTFTEAGKRSLPALDQEGVLKTTGLILRLIESNEQENVFDTDWSDFAWTKAEFKYSENSDDYKAIVKHFGKEDPPDDVYSLCTDLSTYLYGVEEDYYQHAHNSNPYFLVRGLVAWIDASVK